MTIVKKKGKGSNKNDCTYDSKEQEMIMNNRNVKIDFEMIRHNDIKKIESEKLEIEKQRLEMEKNNMEMKERHITAQTNLENSRSMLIRMDMFKQRLVLKKEFPDVTDEYLDANFPYPN